MGEPLAQEKVRSIASARPIPDDTTVRMDEEALDVSLVVPLHNERASLKLLVDECHAVLDDPTRDWTALGIAPGTGVPRWEIILVDDGSTDGSFSLLRELAAADPAIRAIRLRRNLGKATAGSDS